MSRHHDTARRLGTAVLAYLVASTLLVTWAPFDFHRSPQHGVTLWWTWSDLLLNVVLFAPLGFLWQAARTRTTDDVVEGQRRAPAALADALLAGALLSAVIEAGQLLLPERFSSPVDILTNATGGLLGAWGFRVLRPGLGMASVSGRPALVLDLPLAGVVILLVPLLWVSALGDPSANRLALLLPVACTGGLLIGSVHGGHLASASPGSRRGVAAAAGAWMFIGAAPSTLVASGGRAWLYLSAGVALAAVVAAWRSDVAARARARDGGRRVEHAALRLAMPFFAVYVTLASLWPLAAIDGTWRAAWVLAPASEALTRGLLLQALAHLGASTLVGYVTAEFHGRDNRRFADAWSRVLARVLPLVLLLEWARGWNTTTGASGAFVLLALAAGLFGGWLYHLQRDHVRALREAMPSGVRSDAPWWRGASAATQPAASASVAGTASRTT